MKYFLFSILLISLAWCSGFSQEVKQSAPKSPVNQKPVKQEKELSDEDSIRLLILKKIITPWMKEFDPSLAAHYTTTYYIAVDKNKDPSPELLAKFRGLLRPVRKSSESFISAPDGDVVKDKKTKKDGVLFRVSEIKWITKDEVTLTAGSYMGNMASDGCLFTIKRVDGVWVIDSQKECYIS
jgi:hypothetical protein